ncbi:GntR family transcriptional regulator [Novosphingobium decolorationis]|uniref:GntR family transcriptional regulator n=1 Tax=Novosphingobium decolorationis TaxID=2698673 RepID=A0ABX8E0V1_9SPHN|nr:GntR family transcriptional regulator [Novosphingobium decolorationis]QVM82713.1 GntR family transcriptional regulator [Novosphingobium decolorationis]
MAKTSEQVYRQIRAGILAGDFEPGMFVPEDEFASYCGTSRTPVREAIARLVSETLLQRSGTRRVFVPLWSDGEVEELFTLRAKLEAHCAERAAELITPDEIAELRTHADFIDAALGGEADIPGFVEGNRRFHATLLAAARSEPLNQMMRIIVNQVIIHRTAERYTVSDLEQSQRDHRDLIAAFTAHDVAWAGAIARNHIRRAAHAYRLRANEAATRGAPCAEDMD